MISLKIHNSLDYILGVFVFICPALFGFAEIDAARNTFVYLGGGWLFYSLLTQYPYSLAKWIRLKLHLALDVAIGFAIMLAPSVFDYRAQLTSGQNVLHLILGLGTIALVVFTEPTQVLEMELPTQTDQKAA